MCPNVVSKVMFGSKQLEIARLLEANDMKSGVVHKMGFNASTVYDVKNRMMKGWRPSGWKEPPSGEPPGNGGGDKPPSGPLPVQEVIQETPDTAQKATDDNGHKNVAAKTPVKPGGTLATVAGRRPASVMFTIGNVQVPIDPQDFYETYILYMDLVARADIHDSFSTVIKDAVGFVWRNLVARPRIEGGRVIMEVS